jgi:hypothetical protein
MDDPVPGSKRGKGVQHLNSDYWVEDLGCFIYEELSTLQEILRGIQGQSPQWQYNHLLNKANLIFMRALKQGLRGAEAERLWLMASWLTMSAAEMDDFDYHKYTPEQRVGKQAHFVKSYLEDPISASPAPPSSPAEGIFAVRPARIDLLPAVSLERLSLHNELCALKYGFVRLFAPAKADRIPKGFSKWG